MKFTDNCGGYKKSGKTSKLAICELKVCEIKKLNYVSYWKPVFLQYPSVPGSFMEVLLYFWLMLFDQARILIFSSAELSHFPFSHYVSRCFMHIKYLLLIRSVWYFLVIRPIPNPDTRDIMALVSFSGSHRISSILKCHGVWLCCYSIYCSCNFS